MTNCCSVLEYWTWKERILKCTKVREVRLLWIVRVNSSCFDKGRSIYRYVAVRHWHRGAVMVSRGLVAVEGGVRDSRWQHRLACEDSRPGGQGCLPLIFICSTVCFAFKSLAEHEALDTPWVAQEPVHILKTQDPFSKLTGSRTQKDDVWRRWVCAEYSHGFLSNTD